VVVKFEVRLHQVGVMTLHAQEWWIQRRFHQLGARLATQILRQFNMGRRAIFLPLGTNSRCRMLLWTCHKRKRDQNVAG
jgi:hypothetical protein